MSSANPVYDAENELCFIMDNGGKVEAYGSTFTLPEERKFGDIEGVQRYVNKVYEFVDRKNPPTVRARRGDSAAHYETGKHVIAVPMHKGSRNSWACREIVILHEIAHSMTPGHAHDGVFCAMLVKLFNKCIGPEAGFLMYAGLCERGVTLAP